MKKTVFLALFVILILLFAACGGAQAESADTKPAAPEKVGTFGAFETTDLQGNKVTQSIFAGHKITMINIWGTFCNPCIREMPELAKLNNEYEGLQVVGIVIDSTETSGKVITEKYNNAIGIIKTTGATYTHLFPSASLTQCCLKDVTSIPVTIFVNENGDIIGESYVGARNYQQWKEIIDNLPLG